MDATPRHRAHADLHRHLHRSTYITLSNCTTTSRPSTSYVHFVEYIYEKHMHHPHARPVWSEVQSSSTSHGMPHGIDSTSPKGTPSSDRSSSTCPLIRHRRRFIAKGIRPRGLHQQSSSTSHRNFVHTDGHLSRPLTAQLQDASATTAYPR